MLFPALVEAAQLIPSVAADTSSYFRFESLGLDPVAFSISLVEIRWYSLAYIASIVMAYWYLLKLIAAPGAPLARRHADQLIFIGTLGVMLGGRLGFALFYKPELLTDFGALVNLSSGGMSLHGGVLGVVIGLGYLCWRNRLNFLRVCDYIACTIAFGLLFGRLANFNNGELWGRPTDVPWAMIFPEGGEIPRHPSQLYEAGLEGILLFLIMYVMFWKTDARYKPGLLFGTSALVYGFSRFFVEFFRQPDKGLENLSWGLTMGQTLTVPMIIFGFYLVLTAKKRRQRVEPFAGTDSIA